MKSAKLQLVVVDLMSTFVGSGEITSRLLGQALQSEGIDVSDEEELRSVVGLPLQRAVAALIRTGMSLDDGARRSDRVHERLAASLVEHYSRRGAVREVDGATRTFMALRAQGLRIAVATVMPREVVDTLLGGVDWFDRGLVDTIVSASDVDEPRPQPGMIHEAMARTNVFAAARVVKVGETPADLAEGTLAKCGAVVGLTCGVHSRDELAARPHTHLIETISSLLDVLALAEAAHGNGNAATRGSASI